MFKRIPSKREPGQTLWKALSEEFATYFERMGTRFGHFCVRYPQAIFGSMVALLLLSAALSFTVFHHPEQRSASIAAAQQTKRNAGKSPHPLDDGFSRILATGAALKKTLELKREVQGILAKGQLTRKDSLRLQQTLDSLAALQHQIH